MTDITRCSHQVLSIGPGIRRWQAGANQCKHKATQTYKGQHLCTRHKKLHERDDRIRAYIREQEIACPDHPLRTLRVGQRGTILFCSARTRNKERYCRFVVPLPESITNPPRPS